jgi:hypothetical protein
MTFPIGFDDDPRPVAQGEGPTARVRPFVFTFGPDHMLVITSGEDGKPAGPGISLGRRYVVLHASHPEEARERFGAMFGGAFAAQYDLTADGVRNQLARYRMTELELNPDA